MSDLSFRDRAVLGLVGRGRSSYPNWQTDLVKQAQSLADEACKQWGHDGLEERVGGLVTPCRRCGAHK